MIGALAIKNRRKKELQRLGSQGQELTPARNVFTERCHLLFVAGGVFFIVGLIIMIPAFFGDTNFFIYSGSSFGIGIVIFLLACLLSPSEDREDDEEQRVGSRGTTTAVMTGQNGTDQLTTPTTNTMDTDLDVEFNSGTVGDGEQDLHAVVHT